MTLFCTSPTLFIIVLNPLPLWLFPFSEKTDSSQTHATEEKAKEHTGMPARLTP